MIANPRERIVIIGGGASGTLTAARLLRANRPPGEIVLIERGGNPGRGVAYGTTDPAHLLNVPANRMSAFGDDPEHFVRWMEKRTGGPVDPGMFAPRAAYGEYLEQVLADSERDADNVVLRRISDEATSITRSGDVAPVGAQIGVPIGEQSAEQIGIRVEMKSGDTILADRVVLALGSLPPRLPISAALSHGRVVVDPWAPGALDAVPDRGELLVIGTGLTMVDVALVLARRRRNGVIHAISRHGLVPRAHPSQRRTWEFAVDGSHNGPIDLRATLSRVRCEVAKAAESGAGWEDVMDTLRPIGAALWQRLSPDDRARFLRHVRPFWEVHRHRMAREVASQLDHLRANGDLSIHAGRIVEMKPSSDGLRVTFVDRQSMTRRSLDVAAVINATGPAPDWRTSPPALVRSLVACGLARFDPLGLGLDTTPEGFLLDTTGAPQPWLATLGPPMRGGLWETTAVPEIREQARRLADLWCR